MRYLVITADYKMSGIKDEFGGVLGKNDIELPDEIWKELDGWVSDYQEIIHMDKKQRDLAKERIQNLDARGMTIKQKVLDYFHGDAKVKYFSEGLLKYI